MFDEPGAAVERSPDASRRSLGGLQPWQRFVLALFLFLDVTVVGLLLLIVSGCMVI